MTYAPMNSGTVSLGTEQSHDLVCRLYDALNAHDTSEAHGYIRDNDPTGWKGPALDLAIQTVNADANPDADEYQQIVELSDDLVNLFQRYAPEGHYFGPLPTDPLHYGFWHLDTD